MTDPIFWGGVRLSIGRYVVDQLQCLGILQTCEVLKVGMPTRVTYTELKEVSRALHPDHCRRRRRTMSLRALVHDVAASVGARCRCKRACLGQPFLTACVRCRGGVLSRRRGRGLSCQVGIVVARLAEPVANIQERFGCLPLSPHVPASKLLVTLDAFLFTRTTAEAPNTNSSELRLAA